MATSLGTHASKSRASLPEPQVYASVLESQMSVIITFVIIF